MINDTTSNATRRRPNNAAMILSEIGVDMGDFKTSGNICSWAGMCPGNNESAGKRKSGNTRKGNNYIQTINDIL